MKKKIGISVSDINANKYPDWFKDDLDEIEIVQLSFKNKNIDALDSCSGFVLTGGVDIHPSFYGGNENYPNPSKTLSIERDKFEMEAFQRAQKNNIPVLGICRGIQLINVICDGTLEQDLGFLNAVHKKDSEDKIHEVTIVKNSLLNAITDLQSGQVNSAHHQAIKELGKGLMVNSRATDETIEGIEWADKKNKPFLLAVQWHPERMKDKEKSPLSQNIKERFIAEVKNHK